MWLSIVIQTSNTAAGNGKRFSSAILMTIANMTHCLQQYNNGTFLIEKETH